MGDAKKGVRANGIRVKQRAVRTSQGLEVAEGLCLWQERGKGDGDGVEERGVRAVRGLEVAGGLCLWHEGLKEG